MKIQQVEISNFRLLQKVPIDLEKDLSLIIGKNNSGKTSFIRVFDKFLNKRSFEYEDFNLDMCNKLIEKIQTSLDDQEIDSDSYESFKITMDLVIECMDEDDLANIGTLFMDLDSEESRVLLSFEYVLKFQRFENLVNDLKNYWVKSRKQVLDLLEIDDIRSFLKKHQDHYFDLIYKTVDVDNSDNFREISRDAVNKVIRLEVIDASREVANSDGAAGKTLSRLSAKYYSAIDAAGPNDPSSVSELQLQLVETDKQLNESYVGIFDKVVKSVEQFSDFGNEEAKLTIQSLLREKNLFEENTFVSYEQEGHHLPENYNGLGYMNLFSIIFNIHIKMSSLRRDVSAREKPSDINLLFVEEPEAHTHPQMQYVFIKNIKALLENESEGLNLQTVMTTHSSHIASQSDFDDIKYFHRISSNEAGVKNLRDLSDEYTDPETFEFLKKYLTLNNCELFFADKVIFIEGDTERILLPTMMKIVDQNESESDEYYPLLSQNISVVEAGNYAHKFDKFLRFFEIDALIITDIDSIDNDQEVCRVENAVDTSNASIKHFLDTQSWDSLKSLQAESRLLTHENGNFTQDKKGNIYIAFQTKENGYHPRSFEDAFLACGSNLEFVKDHKDSFESLKNRASISDESVDFFTLPDKCLKKKSTFAVDILFHTNEDFTSWQVPNYIYEGLKWLATSKQD